MPTEWKEPTMPTAQRPLDSDTHADAGDGATALDERRGKWQTAHDAATQAEKQLADLGQQLESTVQQRNADEAELRANRDRQAELKKSIKAAAKQRDALRNARKQADRDAARARKRAEAAEAKYEKALLADLLHQQMSRDLSAHDKSGGRNGRRSSRDATPREPSASGRRPTGDTVAHSTSRKTAAAATARKARA